MSQPNPQSAASLLQQVRERALILLSITYLLYIVFAHLFKIHLTTFGLYGYINVAISIVGGSLIRLGIYRFFWLRFTTVLLIISLWFISTLHIVQSQASPTAPLLWLALTVLVTFLLIGSVWGAISLLMLFGALGVLVLLNPLGSQMMAWSSGSVVLIAIALISFLTMRFMERNINLHEEASTQLRAARLDALTGINGRAAAEEELRRAIAHSLRSSTPLSVIVTDIDNFKLVNDQQGHGAGDDVLRSFAKRLRRIVGGSGGIVGRWGGEEFIVILPAVARPDAIAMAERLRQEISISPLAGSSITASFGVASFRGKGDDQDQLFGRADERLYEAKNAGRNAVRG